MSDDMSDAAKAWVSGHVARDARVADLGRQLAAEQERCERAVRLAASLATSHHCYEIERRRLIKACAVAAPSSQVVNEIRAAIAAEPTPPATSDTKGE